eukprot:s2481_g20.t1
MGQQTLLIAGDLCFYWRDAPAGSNAKLRWRGPATVIMREPGPSGPQSDVNRGVTQYVDLNKTNKRRRDEVDTDEEEGQDDRDLDDMSFRDLPPDSWVHSDDGRMWTRLHNVPRKRLFVPEPTADVPVHLFKNGRMTDIRRGALNPEHLRIRNEWKTPTAARELHYMWTGSTTFFVDPERLSEPYEPTTPMDSDRGEDDEEPEGPRDGEDETMQDTTSPSPGTTGPSSSARPTSLEPSSTSRMLDPPNEELPEVPVTPASILEPEPLEEPQVAPSLTESHLPIPPGQKPFFQPERKESFAEQRARLERQETLLIKRPESYGPAKPLPERSTPYSTRPLTEDEKAEFSLDVDVLPNNHLPPGWKFEDGFIVLGDLQDEWRLDGNYLTKMHYTSRNKEFIPTEKNCPVPLHYLTKQRITKLNGGKIIRDKWTRSTACKQITNHEWTGYPLEEGRPEPFPEQEPWGRVHFPAGGQK